KPAVPLAGKYRLIDVPISNCINSGLDRIFVVTQYNSASLNNHIARSYVFDRFRGGFVTILAAEQTPASEKLFQGTADAVRPSMGIYVFTVEVLRRTLAGNPEHHDFGKEIIPGAIQGCHVVAYPFTGYWNDIGTVRSFFETHIMLAEPHPAFNLYDAAMPLYT